MIIFPYGTDAPIYYWPVITVGMIVINIAVFFLELSDPSIVELYALQVGNGLHPVQWLTNNFLHADPVHLIGNMIFLWSFGIVVEGKLGPWKSLIVYIGCGIVYGATVQILTLGFEPTLCLGASAIVYALMMMCMIWAPENSMNCVLLLFYRLFFFEVQIKILVGIYLGMQVLSLVMSGGAMSSEFLHVAGAAVGLGIGLVLLKCQQVDCENWDIFSVWSGRHKMSAEERAKFDAERPKAKREQEAKAQKQKERSLEEIRWAISQGNLVPAIVLGKQMKLDFPEWVLPERDLLQLIQALSEKRMRDEACAAMQEYLQHYHEKASVVRLNLSHMLIEMKQPRAAMKTLQRVNYRELNTRQQQFYQRLVTHLQKTTGGDTYELADEGY